MASGWRRSRLGREINIRVGNRLDSEKRTDRQEDEQQIPVYGAGNVIGFTRERIHGISKELIVLGRVGTVGKPRMVRGECFVLDTAYWVTPKGKNDLFFLYLVLSNIEWKAYAHGTVMDGLRKNIIAQIEVVIPPTPEQYRIRERVQPLLANIAQLEKVQRKQIATTQEMRRSLIHHFATGKRMV